ncbi:hypothetical protein CE91St41_12310 [Oscillospiraceae bacterium]|nr:hypothetical protein CE91St40_25230 [Oscillospiraceae bacterium]BDF74342.1 hypothetical protein CE91St41_12310 [Oscillospiraceae bacterium]
MRRSVDSWLDRFAYKHSRFAVPDLMRYIVFGTAIVYVLDMFSDNMLSAFLSFSFPAIMHGQIWRLVSFIIVPDSMNILWTVVSLLFYYSIGTTMEREWGSAKFTLFYACGVLLTILSGVISGLFGAGYVSMTAVNQSLFLAFATLYPNAQIRLYFILPLKAKWLAIFYVVMMAWNVLSTFFKYPLALVPYVLLLILPPILASLVNYALFFWSDLAGAIGLARHRASRQTVNFKQATRHAQQQKGYLHKCAVCGKTDTEYPDMEFRYCSKCNGYYCYCMEHINNHVHVE